MNTNAIRSTIKSILHSKTSMSRENAATLAETLTDTLIARYAEISAYYKNSDAFDVAEAYAIDYVKRNS